MLDFIKIKEFSVKHTVKIIRQGTHWEKTFVNTYYDIELISKIYTNS